MKNSEWYVITDLEHFVDATRALVFNSFGKSKSENEFSDETYLDVVAENESEEFNKILPHNEAMLITQDIIRKQTHKITQSTRYLVSDGLYSKLVDALNQRMVGNILTNLVNKGMVETAFDSDANDFVFWVSDEYKYKDEKKEEEDPQTD